jgi:hypothetical protein
MRIRGLLVLALCVVSCGCGAAGSSNRLTAENYNRIEGGMTPDQVRAILGSPYREQTASHILGGGSTTAWEYRSGDKRIFIWFRGGVIQKDEEGLGVGMKTYGR